MGENGKMEIDRKNYKKAQDIAKSFLESCIKEGLTVAELEQVKLTVPRVIDSKIHELSLITKLS